MSSDKKTPVSSPLEKALQALHAAQERFALRQKAAEENALKELEEKLRNFDLYVQSVVDAKLSKVLTAKTDRKKNRIRDDAIRIQTHYAELRKQMETRASKAYKKPLYLIAAEERVKALTPA